MSHVGVAIYGYVAFGALITVFAAAASDGTIGPVDVPDDIRPAVLCAVFLLWPLVIVATVLCGVAFAGSSIARGYAALWRRLRGPRIPRATARRIP